MSIFFFFNDTATTEIYTLSLHDALPISILKKYRWVESEFNGKRGWISGKIKAEGSLPDIKKTPVLLSNLKLEGDRKSTRLNSSHANISYAVFCLKKKKQ